MKDKSSESKISGRSSDEIIQNRVNIGIRILKEYNFRLSKNQFRSEYKIALQENGFTVPKDSRTITTDIKRMEKKIKRDYDREIIWTSGFVEKPKPNSHFSILGKEIQGNIRKVYLRSGDKEYMLFNKNKNTTKLMPMKQFKKPVHELYNIRKESGGDCLVHVFLIFHDMGDEENTADFFREQGFDKILFTGVYQKCTEIVSELRYLKTLMEDLYYTLFP